MVARNMNARNMNARNMNPVLLASAISTLLLMHNHWTTASRHSLARLCRHVTEEMCHLDSMYIHSCQCAVGIEDCGWPIHQILIFRLNSRWKGFVSCLAFVCLLREMVWWIELNFFWPITKVFASRLRYPNIFWVGMVQNVSNAATLYNNAPAPQKFDLVHKPIFPLERVGWQIEIVSLVLLI